MKDEVISVVYDCVTVFLGFYTKYLRVLFLYWVSFLCFERFICIVLGLDDSLWVFESIINCKAVFFIDYIMGICFCGLCFCVGLLFLYVLLKEFSLPLFSAASFVKRYIMKGVLWDL